ncbi:MAG: 50S ribosomal protein L10 [Candidatus Methanogaster sp.]|uniref:50S ribosomal protein L10 n=1 Tax=Candidatus Methanogaster sp. TaxID=3386292 RepID=A0AC61L490_9EURY|nr:MAG: 50S ribosomal protein L10 [ANME-2 cluster archaeon]
MDAATEHRTAHVPQWKVDEIESIKQLVSKYSVVAVAGIRDIPAKQLQEMRRNMKDVVKIRIYRNNLIQRALDESNSDLSPIGSSVGDQTALVFTDLNPFKLFQLLKSSKTEAPIRAGAIAPADITVVEGPTSFAPGPIVGDLQNAGIPARIDKGKVVIRETKVVAHAGEAVSHALSEMLSRLEIYPMTVGFDLRSVYDNGTILEADALDIDEAKYATDIATATTGAFNLAIAIVYPTPATVPTLLAKAASDARNLAINSAIPEPAIIDLLLSKAQSSAMALAGSITDPDALGESLQGLLMVGVVEVEVAAEAGEGEEEAVSATDTETEEEAVEENMEEEGESKEEEAAEGLGLLFG